MFPDSKEKPPADNKLKQQPKTTIDDVSGLESVAADERAQNGSPTCKGPSYTVKRSNNGFHYFRYIIIVMGGMAMGLMLLLRLTITVSMVSMVNHTALYIKEHPNASLDEYFSPDYVETGDFDWSNEIQQTIISGYMVAYTIPQFFTTRLTMKYGLKYSISLCLVVCALSNLLIPFVSHWGWQWTLALRLLNGVGGSAILPSMMNAIENWMPTKDTARGLALFQFSCNIIYASAPLISGLLTAIHWQYAFHVPAIVTLIFCILWLALVSDRPEDSKFVSQEEVDLINACVELDSSGKEKVGGKKTGKVVQRCDLPWYFMFKIVSFYWFSIIWALYCMTMGGFLFLLPTYMNRVLRVPIEEVGMMNFTVQIGGMFCMLWPNPATDFLQRKFSISLSAARRWIVFLTVAIGVVSFVYLGVYHEHLVLTISINRFFLMTNDTIVLATVMSQFGHAGISGLVYSMVNTFGNLATVLFCWAVGRFLDYTGETLECWSYVLYILGAMIMLYFIIYALFCHSRPVQVKLPPKKVIEEGGN